MILLLILKGIIIGFIASTPLGPISVFIVHRTVNQGRRTGFYSGVGAALSDSTYATIAAFSLSIIIAFIKQHELIFKVGGAVILGMLGIYILLSDPRKVNDRKILNNSNLVSTIFGTFFLTVTNPLIIFPYIAIFASTGILENLEAKWHTVFLLAGFFIGACCWWFTLTGIVMLLHGRFNLKNMLALNRIAGSAILLFVTGTLIYILVGMDF